MSERSIDFSLCRRSTDFSLFTGVWTFCFPNHLVFQSPDNPEGVASLSPGLLYSATLGDGVEPRTSLVVGPNPERGCVMSYRFTECRHGSLHIILGTPGPQPRWVGKQRDPSSQGSRVQQPWASRRNPFGVVGP